MQMQAARSPPKGGHSHQGFEASRFHRNTALEKYKRCSQQPSSVFEKRFQGNERIENHD
jgi:hypothetical protein